MYIDKSPVHEPASKNTRTFKFKWKTEFPWIHMVESNSVICTICASSGDAKDDWVNGKTLPENCFKSTFAKHARSKKHRRNMQILPGQQNLVKSATAALSKSENKIICLMKNILAALQNEMSINKVELLHTLVDSHLQWILSVSKVENVNPLEFKLSAKHR